MAEGNEKCGQHGKLVTYENCVSLVLVSVLILEISRVDRYVNLETGGRTTKRANPTLPIEK